MKKIIHSMDNGFYIVRAIVLEYILNCGESFMLNFERQMVELMENAFLCVDANGKYESDTAFLTETIKYINENGEEYDPRVCVLAEGAIHYYIINRVYEADEVDNQVQKAADFIENTTGMKYLNPGDALSFINDGILEKDLDITGVFEHLFRVGYGMDIVIESFQINGCIDAEDLRIREMIPTANRSVTFLVEGAGEIRLELSDFDYACSYDLEDIEIYLFSLELNGKNKNKEIYLVIRFAVDNGVYLLNKEEYERRIKDFCVDAVLDFSQIEKTENGIEQADDLDDYPEIPWQIDLETMLKEWEEQQ